MLHRTGLLQSVQEESCLKRTVIPIETAQEALRLGAQKLQLNASLLYALITQCIMIEMNEIRQMSDKDLSGEISS